MKKTIILYISIFFYSTFVFAEEFSPLSIKIHKNLRCLVCQGQSIADSNSEFAQTIKLVIQDKIGEGKTEREIYDFLIEKYGEWIVYKPALNKVNLLLWALPYLMLVFGGVFIFNIVKRRENTKHK